MRAAELTLISLCCDYHALFAGALLLVSLVLLPESPRWLVLRGQLDLALATLHSIVQTSSSGSGRTAAEESVITASETQVTLNGTTADGGLSSTSLQQRCASRAS